MQFFFFFFDEKLYCACGKIYLNFTKGPLIGKMYDYIVDEKNTMYGKQ